MKQTTAVEWLIDELNKSIGLTKFVEEYDEEYLPDEDACEVLYEVGNTDYIYEQIGEIIDDEIARLKLKQSIKK